LSGGRTPGQCLARIRVAWSVGRSAQTLGYQGARVPGCQGARVLGCQGAREVWGGAAGGRPWGSALPRIRVAWSVGKVCPDWEMRNPYNGLCGQQLGDHAREREPRRRDGPRAFPMTPITLLADMGTTRS